ncbi:hypothetical protein DMENIID0001_037900 [Sergentomyia squamirostris]
MPTDCNGRNLGGAQSAFQWAPVGVTGMFNMSEDKRYSKTGKIGFYYKDTSAGRDNAVRPKTTTRKVDANTERPPPVKPWPINDRPSTDYTYDATLLDRRHSICGSEPKSDNDVFQISYAQANSIGDTQIHCDMCPKYQAIFGGVTWGIVPWSQVVRGKFVDLVVKTFAGSQACRCNEVVHLHDGINGEFCFKPKALGQEISIGDIFMVHKLRPGV